MTDFMFRSFGTTCSLEARSEAAKEFAREHFAVEGWQGIAEKFWTDWRAGSSLASQLAAEGWEVVEA